MNSCKDNKAIVTVATSTYSTEIINYVCLKQMIDHKLFYNIEELLDAEINTALIIVYINNSNELNFLLKNAKLLSNNIKIILILTEQIFKNMSSALLNNFFANKGLCIYRNEIEEISLENIINLYDFIFNKDLIKRRHFRTSTIIKLDIISLENNLEIAHGYIKDLSASEIFAYLVGKKLPIDTEVEIKISPNFNTIIIKKAIIRRYDSNTAHKTMFGTAFEFVNSEDDNSLNFTLLLNSTITNQTCFLNKLTLDDFWAYINTLLIYISAEFDILFSFEMNDDLKDFAFTESAEMSSILLTYFISIFENLNNFTGHKHLHILWDKTHELTLTIEEIIDLNDEVFFLDLESLKISPLFKAITPDIYIKFKSQQILVELDPTLTKDHIVLRFCNGNI